VKALSSAIYLRVPDGQRVIQELPRIYGLHVERRAVSLQPAKKSGTCRPPDAGSPSAAVAQVMSSIRRCGRS